MRAISSRRGIARLATRGVARITALVANDDERARGFWFSVGYAHDEAMGRLVLNL